MYPAYGNGLPGNPCRFTVGEGCVYTLKQGDKITALAIVYPAGSTWQAGEIVAETPGMYPLLLQRICEQLNIPSIRVISPSETEPTPQVLGMARIINAKTILQRYAAEHPELKMSIALTDSQISANNGYYYLNNGKCISNCQAAAGQPLGTHCRRTCRKDIIAIKPLHEFNAELTAATIR